ncbi:MFS transporter [Devosia sp.]|uniref:MFS transporter n=1 Tax=Devosia sp. TaxID=1871048 RepID=UPI0032638A4E
MKFGLELPPHLRVFAGFFLYSFCMGSIYPRLPDIQREMGVQEGALGLALIGAAVGTLITLTFGGALIEKIGHRRVLLIGIPLLAVFYALASFANGPLTFFLLLVPVGLTIGGIEVAVNLEADRVEHALGRRIMNRAHGFWSIGFFTSGLVSSFIAQAGLSPHWHLLLMVPVVALSTALILGGFTAAEHRTGGSTDDGPRFNRPTVAILILVGVTVSAMVMEGAGIDWSAIYMKKLFAVEPFWAGFAVAIGAGAQALARFFADRFVERYSPANVARTLLGILGLGVVLVFFSQRPWLSLAGFAMMGVGTSAIFPLAMSAAAQRTDRPAAVNVAALAQTAFVAFLLGPPLLGFIAEHFGIRWAFGIGIPLVAISLLSTGSLSSKAKAVTA